MAISVIGAAVGSATIYQPIDSAGTYTLSTPLAAGAYAITGDSTQTLTFTLINALGYKFDFVMRGGRGRVYIPAAVSSIIAPAGTYPINIGFEKMTLTLPSTPTATFAWNANPSGNATGKFTFTAPSGTTSTRVYWEDGTNEVITSGADVTAKPFVPVSGLTRSPLIVHKNAIGLESAGQILTTPTSLLNTNILTFTASGTWTVPTGVTSADVLVVAGGGSGGMGGNSAGSGGGGGAGGVLISTNYALTPGAGIAYTVGAGGVGVNAGTNPGGNSVFGALTAIGGGGGGYTDYRPAQSGGSGGGGGGYGQNWPGASGTSGQGFAGGSGGLNYVAGGGGGATAAGASSSTNGNGGAGYHLGNFAASLNGVYVGGGGGGGSQGGTGGAGGIGGGGRGADRNNTNMTNGTTNTGGGGGGRGDNAGAAGGANGGSGVIYVKYSA